jgi:hypothetical protein
LGYRALLLSSCPPARPFINIRGLVVKIPTKITAIVYQSWSDIHFNIVKDNFTRAQIILVFNLKQFVLYSKNDRILGLDETQQRKQKSRLYWVSIGHPGEILSLLKHIEKKNILQYKCKVAKFRSAAAIIMLPIVEPQSFFRKEETERKKTTESEKDKVR